MGSGGAEGSGKVRQRLAWPKIGVHKVMIMMRRTLAILAASLMCAPGLLSQEPETSVKPKIAVSIPDSAILPDWNGAWKLNSAQGNFKGPIITISISADGVYRYDDQHSTFTFRCDGKDRPIEDNRTRSCVRSSATVLDLIQKEHGVKTKASRWELSAGGRLLTATATTFRSNGPVVTAQLVLWRKSGSNDFAGQWEDGSYVQQHTEMTVSIDNQTLHLGYPRAGQFIDAPFNGVEAAPHGPHAPKGLTCTARLAGKREILVLMKRDGKVATQDSLALSGDGKVIRTHLINRS